MARLLDKIEEALKPLAQELATCCVLCGKYISGSRGQAETGKVCYSCIKDLANVETGTLGGIVHMSDQIGAAVAEVREAWQTFMVGPQPETGQPGLATDRARQINRIDGTVQEMQDHVSSLRDLARTIRERV